MSDKRYEYLYMARLAEQTERYEDMVEWIKKYVSHVKELTNDERNLLSIAYKNAAGSRRTAWRAISALENKEKAKVYHIYEYKSSKCNLEFKTTRCNQIL